MASGFRVLGYADLDIAHAFIRDCEAEGNEGVCPETYGTRPESGVTRAQLPIQHRDRGYLTEDEIIDMIDSRAAAGRNDRPVDEDDEEEDSLEFEAEYDETAIDNDPPAVAARAADPTVPSPGIVSLMEGQPSRIGSRRELYRLGIDLFEKRMRLPSNRSWKDSTRQRKQFLRHLERLLNQMFPET